MGGETFAAISKCNQKLGELILNYKNAKFSRYEICNKMVPLLHYVGGWCLSEAWCSR